MSIIEDVKGIEAHHVLAWLFLFLSILAPGMLIFYMYHPDEFIKLDTIKLLILSISISLPLPTLNILLSAITNGIEKDNIIGLLGLNMIVSFVFMYASILSAYVWHLNFMWFLGILSGLEVVFLAFLLFDKFHVRKKT